MILLSVNQLGKDLVLINQLELGFGFHKPIWFWFRVFFSLGIRFLLYYLCSHEPPCIINHYSINLSFWLNNRLFGDFLIIVLSEQPFH